MDIEENEKSIINDYFVLLCNKCLENGEYIIPLFYLNDSKKIAYKCSQNHIINEKDICKKVLTEQLIKLLNECTEKEHREYYQGQSNNFCAWCDQCCKNLCQVDFAIDLRRNHKYLLFMEIMPDYQYEINTKQKIKKLKDLIEQYYRLCPDSEEEINYLENTYERNFMNSYLYYDKKILTYQTINNILFNPNDGFDENSFELYSDILKKKSYKFLYNEFLKKKAPNEINKNELNINLKLNEEIAIFNNNNKIYIAIHSPTNKQLKIYDDKGNTLNEISLLLFQTAFLMVYNNNTLAIYDHYKIFIIFFSEDYKSHEILILNIYYNLNQNFNILDNLFANIILEKLCTKEKLIKTSLNNYFFLSKGKAYYLELEKYFTKKISKTIDLDTKLISSDNDIIITANSAFYKNNNDILEGIIYIHRTEVDKKFFYKINMLNEKLENISQIKFKFLNPKKSYSDTIFNINYNYLNDMILVFTNSEIYQINFNTKEIITIYDLPYFFYNDFNNLPLYDSIFLYNYNEKNQKMEGIIIIIDKMSNNFYKLIWKEKSIKIEKKFNSLNIQNIIPLYSKSLILDSNKKNKKKDYIINKDNNNNKKNTEEFLVIVSDNLIILN